MMSSSASHPSSEKLELYLLNFLKEAEIMEIELHFLFCGRCQQRTRKVEEQIAVLRLALA